LSSIAEGNFSFLQSLAGLQEILFGRDFVLP
jgi:hypothetical protein